MIECQKVTNKLKNGSCCFQKFYLISLFRILLSNNTKKIVVL